jgi:hypothetical protein
LKSERAVQPVPQETSGRHLKLLLLYDDVPTGLQPSVLQGFMHTFWNVLCLTRSLGDKIAAYCQPNSLPVVYVADATIGTVEEDNRDDRLQRESPNECRRLCQASGDRFESVK